MELEVATQQTQQSKEEKEEPSEPVEDQWKHNIANKIQKLAIILFERPVFNYKTALKECSKKYKIFV